MTILKKDNITLNTSLNKLHVEIDTRLFPKSTVMRTTFQYTKNNKVILNEKSPGVIEIVIIPSKKTSQKKLLEIGYDFNKDLINMMVVDCQSSMYAPIRNAIISKVLSKKEDENEE